MDRAHWWPHAQCQGMPTETFFIPENAKGHGRTVRELRAKHICRSCPVREPCLLHAIDTSEPHGIWGATTPQERQHIRAAARDIQPA